MLENLLNDFYSPFEAIAAETAFVRLVTAVLLGAAIGFEREYHAHSAGLRTHILISLAACLFTLIAFELIQIEVASDTQLRTDPLRLIEAVTAGVAFLAAGSIITSGGRVHGLTTGAGMWLSGAIGLACGTGRIVLALMSVVIALVVLWVLRGASDAIARKAQGSRHGDSEKADD